MPKAILSHQASRQTIFIEPGRTTHNVEWRPADGCRLLSQWSTIIANGTSGIIRETSIGINALPAPQKALVGRGTRAGSSVPRMPEHESPVTGSMARLVSQTALLMRKSGHQSSGPGSLPVSSGQLDGDAPELLALCLAEWREERRYRPGAGDTGKFGRVMEHLGG